MIKEIWLGSSLSLAILCIFIAFYFLNQSKTNKDNAILRKYAFGMGVSIFFLGFSGIIDFSAMYNIEILGKPDLIPTELQFLNIGPNYFYLIISILLVSFCVLSYQIETFIRQSKRHLLTLVLLICSLISLIPYFGRLIPVEYHESIMILTYSCLLPFGLIIAYWGIFYIRLGIKTTGIVRKRAFLVAFGLGFLFAGIILEVYIRSILLEPYILLFCFKLISIIGVFMLYRGFRRESL